MVLTSIWYLEKIKVRKVVSNFEIKFNTETNKYYSGVKLELGQRTNTSWKFNKKVGKNNFQISCSCKLTKISNTMRKYDIFTRMLVNILN